MVGACTYRPELMGVLMSVSPAWDEVLCCTDVQGTL